MTLKKRSSSFGLACLLAANAACLRAQTPSGRQVRQDAGQTYQDTKAYVGEKKADYVKRIKATLKDLDAQVADLRDKMSGLGADALKKAQLQLKALKRRRKYAGKKFDDLKASSDKEWGKLKKGVDDSLNDLQNAYEDFKADMQ